MKAAVVFRVLTPFLAVQDEKRLVTIPEGTIIKTGEDLHQPGLIHIYVENAEFLAFTHDLQDRSDVVEASTGYVGSDD